MHAWHGMHRTYGPCSCSRSGSREQGQRLLIDNHSQTQNHQPFSDPALSLSCQSISSSSPAWYKLLQGFLDGDRESGSAKARTRVRDERERERATCFLAEGRELQQHSQPERETERKGETERTGQRLQVQKQTFHVLSSLSLFSPSGRTDNLLRFRFLNLDSSSSSSSEEQKQISPS